ncbi:hypothetical protein [Marinoscillum sp.]|uniref:hypothetical protein n=1 Tax=Marinoscillum sp. TaxID=2024838 RepID=UPI003BA9FE73
MSTKSLNSFFLFIVVSCWAYGQSFHDQVRFLEHLETIGEYKEALFYIDQLHEQGGLSSFEMDSLFFFEGRYHYELKEIEQSIAAFNSVGVRSKSLHEISSIYAGFQLSYLRKFEEAEQRFDSFQSSDSLRLALVNYQKASLSLLQRNLDQFNHYANRFNDTYYVLTDYQKDMTGIYQELAKHKRKSPFVAGLLSAIIPGSGKLYNGQIGPGVMGLVSTGIFGLQAYEGYRKDGLKSARFIIFGGLFTTFYVANIWGSVVSVRVSEQRYNHTVDEAIYINMHLPIRLLYR